MAAFDPFREFTAVRRDFDRVSDGSGFGSPRWRMAFLPGRAARQYPLVNMHDDGENLYVEAMAPGVVPDSCEVTVVGNTLTISGEKPGMKDVPPERVHRTERAAGRFMRTVQLPVEIDRDRVGAQYKNGLLLLTLPRSEAAKPRRIQVQAD